MNVQRKEKGFTIIEVVLVLAIAALIFLMIFIALPALQKSQRDTARKNDLSRFATAINNYQSNNKGTIPAATAAAITTANTGFVASYLTKGGDQFADPHTGNNYTYQYGVGAAPTTEGQIRYATSAQCGTNGAITSVTPASPRRFAVSVFMEGAAAFCQQG
ncbi:MAG TPA: type II secretion system protein [Candidatus Saccharimonadales bacterium]